MADITASTQNLGDLICKWEKKEAYKKKLEDILKSLPPVFLINALNEQLRTKGISLSSNGHYSFSINSSSGISQTINTSTDEILKKIDFDNLNTDYDEVISKAFYEIIEEKIK